MKMRKRREWLYTSKWNCSEHYAIGWIHYTSREQNHSLLPPSIARYLSVPTYSTLSPPLMRAAHSADNSDLPRPKNCLAAARESLLLCLSPFQLMQTCADDSYKVAPFILLRRTYDDLPFLGGFYFPPLLSDFTLPLTGLPRILIPSPSHHSPWSESF